MVTQLLLRSSTTFYRQHPLQLLLSVLGIVLGVCIVTAVWITNSSSQRAFALSTEALYGRTTHHIVAAQGIRHQEYTAFRSAFPALLAAPIIEGHALIGNNVFSIIGVDPFSELPFERVDLDSINSGGSHRSVDSKSNSSGSGSGSGSDGDGDGDGIVSMLNNSGLFLSEVTSDRLNLGAGDELVLRSGNTTISVPLLGRFQSSNPAASEGMLIGDIALVQTILGRHGRIDRIDLIASDNQIAELSKALPPTLKISNAASRHQTMLAMTRGFQINLTAMSLLSLLVGAFLIHNTMSFTVLQRRELFAVKRTLGISSQSLFISVLTEAVLISLIGSVIGVLLGLVLAHQLIKLTTQTINDLYFVLHVQEIWFTPALFFGGLALGVGCSLLAASLSAIDAAKTNPVQAHQRSATEQKTRHVLPSLTAFGVIAMLFGIALATTPSQSLLFGFASLMLLIVGYGLLLPGISFYVSRRLKQWLSGLSPMLSMAAGSVERNISRTGLAIAALTIAVSSTFGVDVMIGSFRNSVDTWLRDTLQSDIYLSVPSTVSTRTGGTIKKTVIQELNQFSDIDSISTGFKLNVRTSLGEFDTLVLEPHKDEPIGINIISGNETAGWNAFLKDQAILISEPLAIKYQLSPGDTIQLFTELKGDQEFSVGGVLRDYASSHGQLTMHRNTFNRYWNTRSISSAGLILKSDAEPTLVTERVRALLDKNNLALRIQANNEIHSNSLAIFDRTFEVTRVLRWLTVGVAFVGIFSALLALNLERAREFAVLRATGTSRRQLLLLITSQTIWMGILAGALALPLGWMMAKILIHVINLRSFGWSMQSFIPSGTVPSTFLLSCTAALLAGLYPAWRLSQSHIARQLRAD